MPRLRNRGRPADSKAVTGDHDETTGGDDCAPIRPRLRVVTGPIEGSARRPAVRLRREWKGLTVADLLRDEIVDRLPGQMRSVQQLLARGDVAAAERALPGEDGPVLLAGPGHRRRDHRLLVFLVAVTAVWAAFSLWTWLAA